MQLRYLRRLHGQAPGRIRVLAGDINARDGEDNSLRAEGWRNLWIEARETQFDVLIVLADAVALGGKLDLIEENSEEPHTAEKKKV